MTVYELMSELKEVSHRDPDMEVEIHVSTGARNIKAEISEDAKAGDSISVAAYFDEYCEDISVSETETGGRKKVCIMADCG